MLRMTIRIVLSTIVTLWTIATVTFVLMHSIPGSPFMRIDDEFGPMIQEMLEERYGLGDPLIVQYGRYLGNLVRGDLGFSLTRPGLRATDIIGRTLPPSARLGVMAIMLSFSSGILLGVSAAVNQGKLADKVALFFATLGITTPNFVFATLFIYLFGVHLRWLPVMGIDGPRYYVLPLVALSIGTIAFVSRLTRSSVLDVIRQDFIRTARAKGLTRRSVLFKHVLRNALIPLVTVLGPVLATTLTGSFVIENIFAIPGMGNQLVNAVQNRDYTMIMAMTLFFSLILVLGNMLVDILYGVIDPRISLDDHHK